MEVKTSNWIIETINANSETSKPKLPTIDENSFIKSLTWAKPDSKPDFMILDLKSNCTDHELIAG